MSAGTGDKTIKILVVCGGTGGHIFPALSLTQMLKKRGYTDIVFAIDQMKRTKDSIAEAGFKFVVLDVPKMPYGLSLKWLSFALKLLISYLRTNVIMQRLNPDLVIGFGAFISWPVVSIACSMQKKIVIHEQNAVLGRANRRLIKKADRVCFSFPNPLLGTSPKYRLTGNPVRAGLVEDNRSFTREEARMYLDLSPDRHTVLVLGGSSGASAINRHVVELTAHLTEFDKGKIQFIHITGEQELEYVLNSYEKNNLAHWACGFYQRMGILYKAADLVISRAGATTIAEIALFGLAAIFVPYPMAGSHQRKNAEVIEAKGGALVLEQNMLTAEELRRQLMDLIDNQERIEQMGRAIRSFAMPDAPLLFADLVEELIKC